VPILPADLIYKTANGEDRLCRINLSGFAQDRIGVLEVVYNDTSCISTWNFFYHQKRGQCSHVVKVQDG
jgi:NADH-quinone oxidoreductase subunit F